MPILEIGDRRVEVGQEFLRLSPEEQQKTVNGIASQIGIGAPAQSALQSGEAVAVTPGEKEFREDERLVKESSGVVPGGLKAAAYSGVNTLSLNALSHIMAKYTAAKEGKSYEDAFNEQKRYEKALERQYPVSSGAGTAAGIGAAFTPLGRALQGASAVGRAGAALKAGTSAKLAGTAAPEIVKRGAASAAEALPMAGVAGGMTGVASALENPVTDIDTGKAVTDAAIGAGIGQAAGMALPALSRYFTKFPDPLDAAGNLKPEAQDAVKKAFEGRISPADMDTFKDQLADVFRRKGISEAGAIEALAMKEGASASRALTTGQRPKPEAGDVVSKNVVDVRDAVEARRAELAGRSVSPTAGAEASHEAYKAGKEGYKKAYETVGKQKGAFDRLSPSMAVADAAKNAGIGSSAAPELSKLTKYFTKFRDPFDDAGNLTIKAQNAIEKSFAGKASAAEIDAFKTNITDLLSKTPFDYFMPAIEKELLKNKAPISFEGTQKLFPQSAQAMKYLQEGIASGNLPNANQPFNFANLELTRRTLNAFAKDAYKKGDMADARNIEFMKDGLFNGIKNAVDDNLFSGNGNQVIRDLKQARDLFSEFKRKFYDYAGPSGSDFRKLVKAMVDDSTNQIGDNLPQASALAAQRAIDTGILNKKGGLAFYDRLERVLGPNSTQMQSVKDQIRQSVFNTGGDLKKIPGTIDEFLKFNGPIAQRVFDGQNGNPSVSDLRRLSELAKRLDKISEMPNEQKENVLVSSAQKINNVIASMLVGNIHGFLAGAAAGLGASALQSTGRKGMSLYRRGVEEFGAPMAESKAPEFARFLDQPYVPEAPVRNIQPLLEEDTTPMGYQAPAPLGGARPGRKAGGRVGKLSDRLVSAADRAKKNINNDTKAILNVDDSHVARALEIANRNLEG